MELNSQELLELFENESNITHVSKKYAELKGIEYTDYLRRRISTWKSKNMDTTPDSFFGNETSTGSVDFENKSDTTTAVYEKEQVFSAVRDGKLMDIETYCKHYGLDYDKVKSYKLISHTGTPYFNVVFYEQVTPKTEEFFKQILEDISNLPSRPQFILRDDIKKDSHLLVVDPADIHVGKLADSFETGEDYNSQIAVKRVKEGVEGILNKIQGFSVDKILFVGGNDILHIDTPKRTTTSGTPQDTDGMWYTNFLIAKQLYIEILQRLLEVADVHFVFNPSNHDWVHGWFLADVIKTYFKDCPNITFDCTINHRKYFTYHNNLIGTSHGDGAKIQDLPLLMAHESEDWTKSKHRYFYTHHVHHKTSKDFMGVCVESLRSPSGTDGWHSRNGYQWAPKAIEGFLHSKEHGQIARITHIF